MGKFYELQFELESNCLLDCIHCSSLEMRQTCTRSYSDIDILNFISLFDDPIHIYFTGGEPILYKNLIPLCRNLIDSKKEVEIGLYTTGNHTGLTPISKDYAFILKQAGITDCYFSIYSDLEFEHDAWTNCKGSFINTVLSVRNLLCAGISVKAHLVLTRDNYYRIDDVIAFCQKLGMEEIRILKLTPSGNAKNNWETIGVPLEEQNELIKHLVNKRKDYNMRITFSGYPSLHPCRAFPKSVGCQAGTNLLYIDSSGDIFPCACTKRNPNKFKICNITELSAISKYLEKMVTIEYRDVCYNEE